MGLNISPSIWQSYINAILDCLQSRKNCEAIMDDLLLVTHIKRITYEQIGGLVKSLIKEWTENITKGNANCSRPALQYMGNEIFIENKKVCVQPLRK